MSLWDTLVKWFDFNPEVEEQPAISNTAQNSLISKAKIKLELYTCLEGLSIGESIKLLNELVREQLSADPNLNMKLVKENSVYLDQIANRMPWQDFLFLLSAAIDFQMEHHLFRESVAGQEPKRGISKTKTE